MFKGTPEAAYPVTDVSIVLVACIARRDVLIHGQKKQKASEL